ncbi:hypothetical protein BDL97_04G068500 [Sphagnum fallax]|nr:hypothetical protein BDL97_04G068500 [Sphagnum fallax]
MFSPMGNSGTSWKAGYGPGTRGDDGGGYNAGGDGVYGAYSEGAAYGGMGGRGGYVSYGGSYRSGGGGVML